MTEQQIRFDDGAAYEEMMGKWSRLAGDVFLDWLAPAPGLRWADIGCGNAASTQLIFDRCAPVALSGIDPSEAQIAFARTRPVARMASFGIGDAMALPFPADAFDVAIMALVIFFVPEPGKGVAEMARVVRPGGLVAAYAWDIPGGGFPLEPFRLEFQAFGHDMLRPPHAEVSRLEALAQLWTDAGLRDVETREITVTRDFADFDEFWSSGMLNSTVGPAVSAMTPGDVALLRERLAKHLTIGSDGRVSYVARANAVKGTTSARN